MRKFSYDDPGTFTSSASVREYENNYRTRPCALDAYLQKQYFNFKDSFKLKRLNQFNVRKHDFIHTKFYQVNANLVQQSADGY